MGVEPPVALIDGLERVLPRGRGWVAAASSTTSKARASTSSRRMMDEIFVHIDVRSRPPIEQRIALVRAADCVLVDQDGYVPSRNDASVQAALATSAAARRFLP